ncbi:MAG: GGDEF domain-containing protein, partial [Limnochordia bacterium]
RAIYRAMRKRRPLFGYIAWGWVFLCLAAVYDIIYDVRLLAVGPLLPLGLFIFALAQSVYLSSQFSRSLEQVYHDSLTGLFNRNYLRRVGLRIFHGAQREGSLLSAIMFDIDDFKVLNDSYGHLVGDEVLQALARRAQSLLRHQDLLFRFGGEEFLILLPQANLAMALVIGERLRREIGASPLIFVGTDPLFVKVSVGVSQLSPTTPTLESLISQADGALYRAKQRGKNCVAT